MEWTGSNGTDRDQWQGLGSTGVSIRLCFEENQQKVSAVSVSGVPPQKQENQHVNTN